MQEWTDDAGGMLSHLQADYNVSMDCDWFFKIETVSETMLIMNESQHVGCRNQDHPNFHQATGLLVKGTSGLFTHITTVASYGVARGLGPYSLQLSKLLFSLTWPNTNCTAKQGNYSPGSCALPQLCTWAQRRQKEHRSCTTWACQKFLQEALGVATFEG